MAIYNTDSDAANTAVRAFLTKVGELYLEKRFNTGSGNGKATWTHIKDEIFGGSCGYCEKTSIKLQIEHLIMFNQSQYGLHHPGNIIPVCEACNKRSKDTSNNYLSWHDHLLKICERDGQMEKFENRKLKIEKHIYESDYKYPILKETESHAIRVIAESLYKNIKLEIDKSLNLYKELDKTFVEKQE
jgi:hypothetical protein